MNKKSKILIILFVSIVLIFCVGLTYSFFNSRGNLNSSDQNIAKFIFNAEISDQLNLSLIDLTPGESNDYSFSVSNNYLGKRSNVSVQYQMTIKTYHLIPLGIELYSIVGDVEELVLTCDESYTRNLENELICNTPVKEMTHSDGKIDNYKLKVNFPNEYNDISYSNLVDYINIEIKSWQKVNS